MREVVLKLRDRKSVYEDALIDIIRRYDDRPWHFRLDSDDVRALRELRDAFMGVA